MIKVASYCRVSSDKDDQANSFEAQQRYFKEYIDRQPDWELYEVYADEGITGTSTKKRTAFNRMINDAHMGKFRLIITKEVSRFSRNILDTIAYTRELKQLGVGVLFMNDAINTLEPDAELRLSIMGSIAQEESRKTSSRVKWGQTRQMERGVVFGPSLLGYDVKDGKMTINPEGAELVRLIFQKYGIEKKGTSIIARELREAGYTTYHGNTKWSNSHIIRTLKNEKYVGDLVQKKSITPDYLTHEKKRNKGEEELVVIENHHEPIIDRDLWNLVQCELKKRDRHGALGAGHSNRYVFSGKIKCGECGASFVARKREKRDGSYYKFWCCYTAANEGKRHLDPQGNQVGCNIGKVIRDDLALDILKQVIATLKVDRKWIIRNVTDIAMEAIREGETAGTESAERLEYEISQIMKKKEAVLDAFFSRSITKDEMRMMNERYDKELTGLNSRMDAVKARQRIEYETSTLQDDIRKQVASIISGNQGSEVFLKNVLDHMVIFPDKRIEVRLNFLPHKWSYVLEQLKNLKKQDSPKSEEKPEMKKKKGKKSNSKSNSSEKSKPEEASIDELFGVRVPISVRRPFSSG